MTYRLRCDVYSRGKGRPLYASAGDIIELVAMHGDVLIARSKKGLLFPVHIDNTEQIDQTKTQTNHGNTIL